MPDPSPTRLLVIANRTCPCPGLPDEIARAGGRGEVLVVSPALNSRLRHWVSDVDDAIDQASERLEILLSMLADAGIRARGVIGDSDPVQAIADALAGYPADRLLISTHPPSHSNWLERDLIRRAEERFDVPVTHVVSRYGVEEAERPVQQEA